MTRAIVLSLLLAACGQSQRQSGGGGDAPGGEGGGGDAGGGLDIVGEGEAEGEGDGGEPGGGEIPTDAPDLSACGADPLVGPTPHEVSGRTAGGDPAGMGSRCNDNEGASGADFLRVWVPPRDGHYRIETQGSDFDTVLALRKPICDGDQDNVIQCNDDVGGDQRWSRIARTFVAGEAVLIAVDGYGAADAGSVRLTIERAEGLCEDGVDDDGDGETDCDDSDCAATPVCKDVACPGGQVSVRGEGVEGTTRGRNSDALGDGSLLGDASCGGGGGRAPEAVFGFTAPGAGRYVFSTTGSRFDTILYVRDRWCTGAELACDDDGGGEGASQITLELEANQEVAVIVDGYGDKSGRFSLTVRGVELVCDDGVDDDGDGAIDCDDDDCLSVECATGGDWPAGWGVKEEEMLELVNERRAGGAYCDQDWHDACGPLDMDRYLRLSSRLHSLDMGERNYFEHDNLDGLTPFDRMDNAGFRGAGPKGENIASGYATAAEAAEGLMNSPGHCRNIMNFEYHVVGYGYAHVDGSDMGHYWTQNFGGAH